MIFTCALGLAACSVGSTRRGQSRGRWKGCPSIFCLACRRRRREERQWQARGTARPLEFDGVYSSFSLPSRSAASSSTSPLLVCLSILEPGAVVTAFEPSTCSSRLRDFFLTSSSLSRSSLATNSPTSESTMTPSFSHAPPIAASSLDVSSSPSHHRPSAMPYAIVGLSAMAWEGGDGI